MAIIFNPGLTYHFTETWNNGATAFDGLSFDATDTASAAGSNLLRLGVGGVDKLSVQKDSRLRYGPDASNHWTHLVSATGDLALTGASGGGGGALTVTPWGGKNVNLVLSASGYFHVKTDGVQSIIAESSSVATRTMGVVGETLNNSVIFSGYTSTTIANSSFIGDLRLIVTQVNPSVLKSEFSVRVNSGDVPLEVIRVLSDGKAGFGIAIPEAKLHALSITEQFRLGFNTTNYWTHTVSSLGDLALAGFGGGGGGALTITPVAGKSLHVNTSAANGIVLNNAARLILNSAGGSEMFSMRATNDVDFRVRALNTTDVFTILSTGLVGVGTIVPAAQIHAIQPSTTAAIPVIRLNQADLSEELIRFESTVGVGNPIEAIGAKVLTPTHLVRVHIQGVGHLYMQVGTAA